MNEEINLQDMFKKGNSCYHNKNYDLALTCYDKYLQMCSEDNIQKGSVLYNKGVVLIHQKQYDSAIIYLKESVKLFTINYANDEKIGNSMFNIGFCYVKLRNCYMAYLYFSKSKKYIPTDDQLHQSLNMMKKKLVCKK